MLVTTTATLQDRKIVEYKGVVSGEAILGANAVIGVDLDYETVGQGGSMLMVAAAGTAVVAE